MPSTFRVTIVILLLTALFSFQSTVYGQQICPDLPDFALSPQAIAGIGSEAFKLCSDRLDALTKIPAARRTFANTVRAMENAIADLQDSLQVPMFMGTHSGDRTLRKTASKLVILNSRYLVDVFTRRDLYNALQEVPRNDSAVDGEDQAMFDRLLQNFRRNGLELSDEKLGEYRVMKKRLDDCKLLFLSAILKHQDLIEVEPAALDWLSEEERSGLEKTGDGRYIVRDYRLIIDNSADEAARKEAETLLHSRCITPNLPRLNEMLQLRKKIAGLLGYKNFAAYAIADKSMPGPEAVLSFIDGLIEKLKAPGQKELAALVSLKARETGQPAVGLNYWDLDYYRRRLKLVDRLPGEAGLSEYLPLDGFLPRMLGFFGPIFGVTFKQVKVATWHESVVVYETRDERNELLGYLFFDLLWRENSQNAFCCESLVRPMILPGGRRRVPSVVISGGIMPPVTGGQALLSHRDVEYLLHEFGHGLHTIFSNNRYATMNSVHSSCDLAEIPSTFMENWAWDPEALKSFSGHCKTGEPLPEKLLKSLIAGRNSGFALNLLEQLMFSKFDLLVHSSESGDPTLLLEKLHDEILMIPMTKGTATQAAFPHLANDYESGYYTYLWADTISSDIFSEFERSADGRAAQGKRFRELVLARSRQPDATALIAEFLGRPYDKNALLKKYGMAE